MGKTFRQVDEFEFPESFGFKGSAGNKVQVKGYDRTKPVVRETVRTVVREAAKPGPSIEGVVRGRNPFADRKRAIDAAVDGYAKGGAVKACATAVHKHEKHLHKGQPETKLAIGGRVMDAARKAAQAKAGFAQGMQEREVNIPQHGARQAFAALRRGSMTAPGAKPMPVAPAKPLYGNKTAPMRSAKIKSVVGDGS